MIKDDGEVIHFNNPKVQASLAANTFAVSGHAEIKRQFSVFILAIYLLVEIKSCSLLSVVVFVQVRPSGI